jgi:GNAT superfamily N-acetyltransferase
VIRRVETAADWARFRALVLEYGESLGFDLCFQGFDEELAALAEIYAPPTGAAFLVIVDDAAVGCVGVRAFAGEVCELKRMYLHPDARGRGLGRALAECASADARHLGYKVMRLDTLETMTAAIHVYESMGFRDIEPYRDNPLDGARYLELTL